MQYDILIVGPVSLDHNIDCDGTERFELGGAIVASGFAAANSGAKTALFTKYRPGEADPSLFSENWMRICSQRRPHTRLPSATNI